MADYNTTWAFTAEDRISNTLQRIDRRFNRLDRSVNQSERVLRRHSRRGGRAMGFLRDRGSDAFSSLSRGAGGFGSALTKLPGPLKAVGVVAGATLGVAVKSFMTAGKFRDTYDELETLTSSMGRGQEELAGLQDKVLKTAFDVGIAPREMSQAFYDVQSLTGRFGKDVEGLTARVGEFAQAMHVDFSAQVNASATAMKIFGHSADQVDKSLRSSVAAVTVGKATYEELAKVQGEFFDSAAGSGQSEDVANKVFAVQSIGAKSADTAATATNGFFEGLTSASVARAFRGIKVDVFDKITQKIRSADDIMRDLIPKIEKMSDARFAQFREKVGGNDGFKKTLDKIRAMRGEVAETFDAFDQVDVNIDKMMERAKKNPFTQWKKTMARFEVVMIRLGNRMLPKVADALEFVNQVMMALSGETEGVGKTAQKVANVMQGMAEAFKEYWKFITWPIREAISLIEGLIGKLQQARDWMRDTAGRVAEFFGIGSDNLSRVGEQVQAVEYRFFRELKGMEGTEAFKNNDANAVFKALQEKSQTQGLGEQFDRSVKFVGGQDAAIEKLERLLRYGNKLAAQREAAAEPVQMPDAGGPKRPKPTDFAKHLPGGDGTSLISAGPKIKHITINIQQVQGIGTLHTTNIKEAHSKIGNGVLDTLVTALRDAEEVIGS